MKTQPKTQNLVLRGKEIGVGRPKAIVPIVATTADDILAQAEQLCHERIDCVEWRTDFFDRVMEAHALDALLHALRDILGDMLLLVTYRRAVEGGEGHASLAKYCTYCQNVCASGCADLLDVELSVGSTAFADLCAHAKQAGVAVVGSSHNFALTPPTEEMVATLCKMQQLGANIAKLAVMPNSKRDLLSLLDATTIMAEEHNETPIITMSMGQIGQASRVCGASFGSAMTFASLGTASAPGQIALPEMNQLLDVLYGTN